MIRLRGKPNEKQAEFFKSRARFTAYGGSRGGGKSWALRRKLILLCLNYPGIHCLIIRRTLSELRNNHVLPFLTELGKKVHYNGSDRIFTFSNGSRIELGYLSCDSDTLRYQGQEYDIIAIDEATQITEYQFSTLKGCLRGVGNYPRRMYLTCNPGGVGHAWVKRLFVDLKYRDGERSEDYKFIRASVYDNSVLMNNDPDYLKNLESLPDKLREAWLYGRWDIFEGQFFPEFSREKQVISSAQLTGAVYFGAMDYGFDRFVLLVIASLGGKLYVTREVCESGLTVSAAAKLLSSVCRSEAELGRRLSYITASPDLWNRRQDTGYSGYEIIVREGGIPSLIKADDRRVPGWRALRDKLSDSLYIYDCCTELITSMESLLSDKSVPEDASGTPHNITHAPEALRYGVMSRCDRDVTVVSSGDSSIIGF